MSTPLMNHLAIIMDGNGRWAINQEKPRVFGHQVGAQTAKKIIDACIQKKIPYLTLYTFSKENWSRPKKEVTFLKKIVEYYRDDSRINIADTIKK